MSLWSRIRYSKDDPLRDLWVPRSERLNEDDPDENREGEDEAIDKDAVRAETTVVPEAELQ